MTQNRPRRPIATRLNTLAACLAGVLAAGGATHSAATPAGDSHSLRFQANARSGAASRFHGTPNRWLHDARPKMTKTVPAHPAVTHTVINCDDAGTGSLRQAVADALDGDAIDFDLSSTGCSTITLESGAISVTAPNLTINGPGQELLTIDGGDASLVFSSKYGIAISDLTIAHGGNDAAAGGCLSIVGDLTLTRSTVTGCRAGNGSNASAIGAGVNVTGNLSMLRSTISDSTTSASGTAYGGGAYVGGDAYLDHSVIAGNTATAISGYSRGGGLFALGNVDIARSQVRDNLVSSDSSTAYGGGVYSAGTTIKVRAASTISGNTAWSETEWSYGGGIQGGTGNPSANITLSGSTLSANIANSNCAGCINVGGGAMTFGRISSYYSTVRDNQVLAPVSTSRAFGGGLATNFVGDDGAIVTLNSTVSGNNAMGGQMGMGGGVAALAGSPFVGVNTTIAFNQASHVGGGAFGAMGSSYGPGLSSSIVSNNQAPDGADVATTTGLPVTMAGSNNIIMVASAEFTLPIDTISEDPQLLPLANNGGHSATHALAASSPAIDAGLNPLPLNYDQRSCPFLRESGAGPDIGAFELQPPTDHMFGDGFDDTLVCP